MVKIIILIIAFLIMLIISYYLSYDKILITPQFLFIAGFLISITYSVFWIKTWDMYISDATFCVLLFGAVLFLVVSLITQTVCSKYSVSIRNLSYGNTLGHRSENVQNENNEIIVEKWKLIVFAILQISSAFIIIYILIKQSGGGLTNAIYYYRVSSLSSSTDGIVMPTRLYYLKNLCIASGYVWCFLLAHSIIYKYQSPKLLLIINVILSAINYALSGARTGVVQIGLAFVVQLFFLWGAHTGWRKKLKTKTLLKCAIIVVFAAVLFQAFGNLLGRNSTKSVLEYIAVYLSAEIKNLDVFIGKGQFGSNMYNCQTLIYAVNFLSGKLGLPRWSHSLDIPFMSVNGHSLGNVATTYYAFLYDAGYFGVAVFIIIMAIIGQIVHMKVVKTGEKGNKINICMIAYSYMCFEFAFSFFSNKFYEQIFNKSFVYSVICWIVIACFVKKVKFKKSYEVGLAKNIKKNEMTTKLYQNRG